MTGEDNSNISVPTNKELVQTQAEREALKKENDAMEQELLRAEKLRAQSRMAGKAQIVPQEEKKEETPKEYSKRVMSGGLNASQKKGI